MTGAIITPGLYDCPKRITPSARPHLGLKAMSIVPARLLAPLVLLTATLAAPARDLATANHHRGAPTEDVAEAAHPNDKGIWVHYLRRPGGPRIYGTRWPMASKS